MERRGSLIPDMKHRSHQLFLAGLTALLCSALLPVLAQTDTLGTWQGGDPAPPAAAPAGLTVSHEDWFVSSTNQAATGRGALGKNLNAVRFLGEQFGVAAGQCGAYRTRDGGLTWTRLRGPETPGYDHLLVTSRSDYWVTTQHHPGGQPGWGRLLRSRDGGETWEEVLAGRLWYSPLLVAAGVGWLWAVSYQGPSFQSTDGGESWEPLTLPSLPRLRDGCVVGNGSPGDWAAYLVGWSPGSNAGVVLKSTDRGQSWQTLALPAGTPPLARGFFLDQKRGWVAGEGVLLATEDGGETWEARATPSPRQVVSALLFFQNGCGWMAYYQPFDGIGRLLFAHTLYSTRDGGRSWRPVLSGYKSVQALWSDGPGACCAVGNTPGFTSNDLVALWNGRW